MSKIRLSFFGSIEITVDEVPAELPTRKAVALLCYLAITNRPQPRERLATLFWPEFDHARSKTSLRRALADLRKALGKEWLLANRQTVELDPTGELSVDVHEFRALLGADTRSKQNLSQALALYTADFLDGFALKNSLAFDEWQFYERESLRQLLGDALTTATQLFAEDEELTAAIEYGRRLVALDPLHEPATCRLMELYAQNNQWTAVVRQFEICQRLLLDELGVTPDAETMALFERLKSERGQGASERVAPKQPLEPETPTTERHNLPRPATSFIGRQKELEKIGTMLADPQVRLLTILGLGGIGKTRLALEAARLQIDRFAGGVWFVDVLAADSTETLAIEIAQALQVRLQGSALAQEQVLEALQQRGEPLLLMLDNFEQLTEGGTLISYLLSQTEWLKVLITSRERLDLVEEWIFAVEGLQFPAVFDEDDPFAEPPPEVTADGQFEAVNLFVQRARQASQTFVFTDQKETVVEICRLVEGLPLALELAAAWVRMLSCEQIISKIGDSLDFLSSTKRNVVDRHLSIRAVFEASWGMLLPDEQDALAQLSIMRGGFTTEAAETVTNASIFTLNGLVNKSLLRVQRQSHFALHELVRQFGADKFEQNFASSEPQFERLMSYYMSLLHSDEETLFGAKQAATLDRMELEIDNIYQAWVWAVRQGRIEALLQGFHSLYNYHSMRSKYAQGERIFGQTISLLERRLSRTVVGQANKSFYILLIRLLARRGEFLYIIGQLSEAKDVLLEGSRLCENVQLQNEIELIAKNLGVIYYLQGEYEKAKETTRYALKLFKNNKNHHEIAYSYMNLGAIALAQGETEQAIKYHEACLKIYQEKNYDWGVGNSYRFLSLSSLRKNELDKAAHFATKSLEIFTSLQTETGIALVLNNLGLLAYKSGDEIKAFDLFNASLQAGKKSNSYVSQASTLQNMGRVEKEKGNLEQSFALFIDSLKLAAKSEAIPLALNIILDIIPVLALRDSSYNLTAISEFVKTHPAANWETRSRIKDTPKLILVDRLSQTDNKTEITLQAVVSELVAFGKAN